MQPAPPDVPVPAAGPPPTRPGFFRGLRLFFGGFGTIAKNPPVWPLALVPVVAALGLMIATSWASIAWMPDLVARFAGTKGGWLLTVAQVLGAVAGVVLGVFLSLALAQPLSGPALEALVRHVERGLGAPERPNTPFLEDVARSLASSLLALAFGLPILVALFFLGFVPGAAFVTVPLKFLVAATIVGWELCDYPMSVRGVRLRERIRLVSQHFGAVLGLSLGVAAIALLPCGLLFVLPAGVAGATRLLHEIQAWEGSTRPGRTPNVLPR